MRKYIRRSRAARTAPHCGEGEILTEESLQFGLEIAYICARRLIALRCGNERQPAHLVDEPFRLFAVGKYDIAARHCPGALNRAYRHLHAACRLLFGIGRILRVGKTAVRGNVGFGLRGGLFGRGGFRLGLVPELRADIVN